MATVELMRAHYMPAAQAWVDLQRMVFGTSKKAASANYLSWDFSTALSDYSEADLSRIFGSVQGAAETAGYDGSPHTFSPVDLLFHVLSRDEELKRLVPFILHDNLFGIDDDVLKVIAEATPAESLSGFPSGVEPSDVIFAFIRAINAGTVDKQQIDSGLAGLIRRREADARQRAEAHEKAEGARNALDTRAWQKAICENRFIRGAIDLAAPCIKNPDGSYWLTPRDVTNAAAAPRPRNIQHGKRPRPRCPSPSSR